MTVPLQLSHVGTVVRAPKTAELIARQLRGQVVRGDLKPGDTLPPEVQLLEQFGVSRPTLREAFRILETEGLISVRRGARGGAQVMKPDLSVAARYVGLLLQVQGTTIEDVYEARMVAEPYCARLLAKRRTKQDLTDLRDCVAELRAVVDAGTEQVPDPLKWSGLTYAFHELLMQRAGNNTLAVQGGVLQDIVHTHLDLTVSRNFRQAGTAERFRRTIRSYTKLIDLVEAKDADAAEAHWRTHMEVAGKALLGEDIKSKRVVDLFS
ncbi:MAG: FadR family transcriptional regulator [Frankiales bacterium]|nr:FadR family transcriptional regulator [Frankiales bacterium]